MKECPESEYHRIIRVGDLVRYLPTGTIFQVKEIYADNAVGIFNLPSGKLFERRAVIVPSNDCGHYPVGEDIAKICGRCGKEIKQDDEL